MSVYTSGPTSRGGLASVTCVRRAAALQVRSDGAKARRRARHRHRVSAGHRRRSQAEPPDCYANVQKSCSDDRGMDAGRPGRRVRPNELDQPGRDVVPVSIRDGTATRWRRRDYLLAVDPRLVRAAGRAWRDRPVFQTVCRWCAAREPTLLARLRRPGAFALFRRCGGLAPNSPVAVEVPVEAPHLERDRRLRAGRWSGPARRAA